jgi:hypothetical protein
MIKLFLELKLVDEYGHIHGVVRQRVDRDVAFMGNRIPMKEKAELGLMGFEETV